MAAPAELRKRRGALPPAALLVGAAATLRAPVCPLNKGPSPQAVGRPGLGPRREPGAPRSQGSDCSFRASCRLLYQISLPHHLTFSLCYASSAGGDTHRVLGQPLCLGLHVA